jgi:hypothetical protein
MSTVHAEMNGWWHPVKVTVELTLNNITEAQDLRDCIKKIGHNDPTVESLQDFIQDQSNLQCGTMAFYESHGKDY